MMLSRTMYPSVLIAVCFSLLCYANGISAEITPTQDSSAASRKNETVQVDITAYRAQTTESSDWNTTSIMSAFSNTSDIILKTPVLTISTTVTSAAPQSTVKESQHSTVKHDATLLPSTTVPLSGPTVPSSGPTVPSSGPTVPSSGATASSSSGTYSSTTLSTTTSSNQTNGTSASLPTQEKTSTQNNATDTYATPNVNDTTLSDTDKNSMKYSEIILTSIFSTILVVVVLLILAYGFKKFLIRKLQYSHHPLRETSYESDRYTPPDDTLVISGGLYDAPRIYNPNMTVLEEEEPQNDYASFNSRSGQFRLEFLPGDKDLDPNDNSSLRRNV
ncbi:uncharacterized protein [Hyperolius riggenbachi]|uniref:uncharacterized protein isoform X2 n=1 Tax=Hyperolius riggenbachi TaxID=752182 RepID=UPI0035A2F3A4